MKTLGIRIDLGRLLTSITGLVARNASSTDARQAPAGTPHPASAIPVPLEPGSLWRVDGPVPGLRVRCDHGRIWLTQTGLGTDILLGAGQTFRIEHPGALLLQPLRETPGHAEAHGTLLVAPGATRPALRPVSRGPLFIRIGLDLVPAPPTRISEALAWTALAACGLFTTAWWIRAVLSFLATG